MSLAITLNRRVTIQQRSAGRDAAGQPLPDAWTDVATVWAGIRDLTGREYLAANAEQAAVTTKIIIRFRDDIEAAMRAIAGEDEYNIEAVLGQDRRWLTLMCVRGA